MKSYGARLTVRLVAIVASITAVWLSYHLSATHVELAQQTKATTTAPAEGFLDRMCSGIIPNTSCEEALRSEAAYSNIGQYKVPRAYLGLFYFTAVFWWLVLIGWVDRRWLWLYVAIACVAALSLGFSGYMTSILLRMTQKCPLCLASHACNLLLFISILLLWPRGKTSTALSGEAPDGAAAGGGPAVFWPQGTARAAGTHAAKESAAPGVCEPGWPHGWMLAATSLIILMSIMIQLQSLTVQAMTIRNAPENAKTELQQAKATSEYYQKLYANYENKWQHAYTAWALNPVVQINTADAPSRFYALQNGKLAYTFAPVATRHHIVIFSDFQCGTCREFENWLPKGVLKLAAQRGVVQVTFKHYPICIDCNPATVRSIHPAACRAALAAIAAQLIGGNEAFWKMHDLLLEKQDEWKIPYNGTSTAGGKSLEEYLKAYAQQIGLPVDRFVTLMNSREAMQRIEEDLADAASVGSELVAAKQITEAERQFLKVDSTPAVFLDGKRMYTWRHFKTWQAIFSLPVDSAWAPPEPVGLMTQPATAPE